MRVPQLTLNMLTAVIALYQTKSFEKAGTELKRTPSGVQKRIAALNDMFGTRLFTKAGDSEIQIRQDRLEQQLLASLTHQLLKPEMMEYAIRRFTEEVQKKLDEARQQMDNAANGILALQAKRLELKGQATNVTEAIAAMGHSPSLLKQLATIEQTIAALDDQIIEKKQLSETSVSLEDLRTFFTEKASSFSEMLRRDVGTAKMALAKHVEKIVLSPEETPEGPVYAVSGNVDFFFDGQERMLGDSCPGHHKLSRRRSESMFRPSLIQNRRMCFKDPNRRPEPF